MNGALINDLKYSVIENNISFLYFYEPLTSNVLFCVSRPVVGKEEEEEVRSLAPSFFLFSFLLVQYRDVSVHLNPIPIPLSLSRSTNCV